MGVRHLSFQVQAAFLLTILCRSVTNDAGIALRANGDILDLAANGLFQIFHIAAGSFRQVLVLAHGGDIAVPARQLDDNRLCIVQSLAGREAVGHSAVSQLVLGNNGNFFHIIQNVKQGQGQLIDASGNVLGAIDYSAGTLHFMPDGTAPLPKPTYAWVTVGTKWVGNQQIAVQRWTMTGIQYHNTAYTFPDGEGGWVDVTYRNNNSAQAQNATLTAQALRIDVTPGFSEAILEGSMRFTLGGSTYVDRQGLLYRDPDPATGAGIQAGTIDYSNGLAVLADPDAVLIWFAIIVVVVTEISLITPPIGMNVFVLRSVLPDVTLGTIFRGVFVFWVADIFRLALIIGVPALSLWLVT